MDHAVVQAALEVLQPLIPPRGCNLLEHISTTTMLDDIMALQHGCGPEWVHPNSDQLCYNQVRKKFFGVPNGEPYYDKDLGCDVVSCPSYSAAYRPKSDWRCETAPRVLFELGEEARAAGYEYFSPGELRDTPFNGIFLLGYFNGQVPGYYEEEVPISSSIGIHQARAPPPSPATHRERLALRSDLF